MVAGNRTLRAMRRVHGECRCVKLGEIHLISRLPLQAEVERGPWPNLAPPYYFVFDVTSSNIYRHLQS